MIDLNQCNAELWLFNKFGDKIEKHIPKFLMGDVVYVVYKRFGKIIVRKTEIEYIAFTSLINYKTWHCGTFNDDSVNIFKTKDEAYEYAEKLNRRKDIKFVDR